MTVPHGPGAAGGGCHPAAVLSPPLTGHWLLSTLGLGQASPQGLCPPSTALPWCTHGCSARGGCAAATLGLRKPIFTPPDRDSWCPEAEQGSQSCSQLLLQLGDQPHAAGCPTLSPSLSPPRHEPATHRDRARVSLPPGPSSRRSQMALGPWQKGVVLLPCPGRCCVPGELWTGRRPGVNHAWLPGLGWAVSLGCGVVALP